MSSSDRRASKQAISIEGADVDQQSIAEAAADYLRSVPTVDRPVGIRKQQHVIALNDLTTFLRKHASISDVTSWHLRKYFSSLERAGVSDVQRRISGAVVLRFFRFLRRTGQINVPPTVLLPAFPGKPRRRVSPKTSVSEIPPHPPESPQLERSAAEAIAPKWISARQLRAHLDTLVVGQAFAKVQLSVLCSMHLSWFDHQRKWSNSPNAILMGPTGVGKTHTLRTAAQFLGLPFISVDATSLVTSGIVGYQVEELLGDLVKVAGEMLAGTGNTRTKDDDIDLARRGVIFLDEFDKLAVPPDGNSSSGGNYSIQRRLLKLAEGAVLSTTVRQRYNEKDRLIDTSGILVLAGGAFAGIEDNRIRSKRPEELKRELSRSTPNLVVSADIVNYGFIPELIARLPVLIDFVPLEQADLAKILDISEVSPLQVWLDHFKGLGKEVNIDEDAKTYAAKAALSLGMGARGLQQIIFPCLAELAYEIEASDKTCFTLSANHIRDYRRPTRPSRTS